MRGIEGVMSGIRRRQRDGMMRPRLLAALVALGLLWLLAPSAQADYDAGKKAYDAGDFDTAYEEWKAAALQGDAQAQYDLGIMLANGVGVPRDVISAYAWLMLAHKGGIEEAKPKYDLLLEEYIPRHCHFDALALVRAYERGQPERLAAGGRQKSRCWNFKQN
jgi:TPR repeat protein